MATKILALWGGLLQSVYHCWLVICRRNPKKENWPNIFAIDDNFFNGVVLERIPGWRDCIRFKHFLCFLAFPNKELYGPLVYSSLHCCRRSHISPSVFTFRVVRHFCQNFSKPGARKHSLYELWTHRALAYNLFIHPRASTDRIRISTSQELGRFQSRKCA